MAHVAVVLAAGASRRLGRPKQLLTRDGETLLHRAARLALDSGAARVLVVLGARHETMRAALADLDVTVSINADWEQGMASSLQAAARSLAEFDGSVLVLGCDQPALEAAHLRALVAGAAGASSGCAATLHRQALGVPALIAPALWREATDLQGDRGFGAALARQAAGSVWRLQAPELEQDLDTPGDVEAAIVRGWIDSVSAGE
ncbi:MULTISPECIES: nucleotidyltransferase family protein [unclassified Lysobacter]|uniref:nucleotidyltransferase family protein n=1 Tax=unclassified Lysobacter TaxID=2635362 RepID=UPI001BEB70A6|nr:MULTISPECIES: nucleotidyltransferase family protein [unclassified Lysobacter]MBT2747318.1 nucleotidyltransferase family protein [Lysobacter sp. ISL-42]MBT2752250.1 nucleotidyltransferase family protein [Lysobacter sp. ISL-50]MBT2778982.1 nucleotidyltransferase family protein [Lysobacter sp. ISL-54]MBT2783632.1 nucleotidyltransferase family protein [Lysobacter sp. ISL-52]